MHLDVDAVLLGELALAPFDRWVVGTVWRDVDRLRLTDAGRELAREAIVR